MVVLGRLEDEAAQAVHRVAGAVERALYAPPGADTSYEGLADDVLLASAALLATVSRGTRVRALLLPRSLVRLSWAASTRWSGVTARGAALSGRIRLPLRDRG